MDSNTFSTKIDSKPYYVATGNEEQVFRAAFNQGLSILLKGPTGCGKTRFVEAMAHAVDRPLTLWSRAMRKRPTG